MSDVYPPKKKKKSFYVFYEAFVIKPFQILCLVSMYISRENTIGTSFTSEKCLLAKFCQVDPWS